MKRPDINKNLIEIMCDKIYHKCRVTIIFLTGAVLELPDPLFIFYPPHSEQNGGKETELDF